MQIWLKHQIDEEEKSPRLAVLDKAGKLVGVITTDDIARSLRRSAEELALTFHVMSRSKEDK